jgi:Xaa-Pro aminopeptidase
MDEKRERLDVLLDERDLEAVWFARPNSFAWLVGGNNVVDREGAVGVAAAGYDGDAVRVVTSNIEAPRLREEELPEYVTVEAHEWHDRSLPAAVADASPTPAGADFDVPGFERIEASHLRQPLTDADAAAFRELGREAAASVESVCREVEPGDTEREVAAALRVTCAARGIELPVVLVGGSDRAPRHRHYEPTTAELGDYALVSVTAQRGGLHASMTRTVTFDAPEWLEERHRAAARVETTALAATREAAEAGGTAGDVFAAIQDAYEAVGWPGEWENHHQGGAAGYAGREWIATPDHDGPVTAPMGYAWNPTVQGTKSEDTVLLAAGQFESVTDTGGWPTADFEAVGYDVTLQRRVPVSL